MKNIIRLIFDLVLSIPTLVAGSWLLYRIIEGLINEYEKMFVYGEDISYMFIASFAAIWLLALGLRLTTRSIEVFILNKKIKRVS